MTTKPSVVVNNTDDETSQPAIAPPTQLKREIYPEVNDRLKGAVMWLGFIFIVVVIWVQYFSGYS